MAPLGLNRIRVRVRVRVRIRVRVRVPCLNAALDDRRMLIDSLSNLRGFLWPI